MKKQYITPQIEFNEIEDLMDNTINQSKTWDGTEAAKRNTIPLTEKDNSDSFFGFSPWSEDE